ncbi:MAG: ABC transporter permease, partial [Aestuariibacter sp.]|nr:ABC transporter permease [Aestuariibacter sp.]
MNYFIIGFYALLIGGSSIAAYYQKRTAFLLLFSLTLVSFIMGIVGGESMLWAVTILAGLIAFSAGVAYSFREFLVIILPADSAKAMKTAPLTAGFGMFVIFTYAISGIFAPVIAPFGEA